MLVVDEESLGPGLSTVGSHEHATFVVGAKRMTESSDINDVRVVWIDYDCRNPLALFQTHVLPGSSAISRFVNTVAEGDAVSDIRLACAHPDHVWISWCKGDIADRQAAFPFKD